MADIAAIRDEALRLRADFVAQGAEPFEAAILQPAEILLDLYGEDIRGRAYVTADPEHGEQMLRPDFTVPVVQAHMASGRSAARYTYCGPVFRQQEQDPGRPNEYFQTGLEIFGGAKPAEDDAEVFAAISEAVSGLSLRAVTGDIGLLSAAIDGLEASDIRKSALRRHMWRPRRFRTLLERYAGRLPTSEARRDLLAKVAKGGDVLAQAGPQIGLRSNDEVLKRLAVLVEDAEEPVIPSDQVDLLDRLLNLKCAAPDVLPVLRAMEVQMPSLAPAADRIEARLDALIARDVDVATLDFEGSFGRTALEYYDGFVFGLMPAGQDDWPPVASGGRYDALTRVLGAGREIQAVGGVIRPGLIVDLKDAQRC